MVKINSRICTFRARRPGLPNPGTHLKWFRKWIPKKRAKKAKQFIAIGQAEAPGQSQSQLLSVGPEPANIGKCVSGRATVRAY